MRHSALPVPVIAAIEALPHDAHPMGVILAGLNALSTFHPEQNPALQGGGIYASHDVQDKQIVRIIGKMTTLAAHAYHRNTGRTPAHPVQTMGYAENFLYMLDAGLDPNHRPNPRLAKALDVMFLLHAEHEMNCSTAAARHLASSGVDVYSAVAGAVHLLRLHAPLLERIRRLRGRVRVPVVQQVRHASVHHALLLVARLLRLPARVLAAALAAAADAAALTAAFDVPTAADDVAFPKPPPVTAVNATSVANKTNPTIHASVAIEKIYFPMSSIETGP